MNIKDLKRAIKKFDLIDIDEMYLTNIEYKFFSRISEIFTKVDESKS